MSDMTTANVKGLANHVALIRFIPICVLLIGFAVADLVFATMITAFSDTQAAIFLGGAFSQVTLLAVWAALGPTSVFKRVTPSFAAATLLGFASAAFIGQFDSGSKRIIWFSIILAPWLMIQAPLWILRLAFGWRLCWPNETITGVIGDEMRFGIRQLMVWTALVSVTLGVGRWLMPDGLTDLGGDTRDTLIVFGVLFAFNSLLAWPIIWATLMPRYLPVWLIAATVCVVGVTVAEIMTFHAASGRNGGDEVFWMLNVVQAATAAIGLLLVRLANFRLVRRAGE